MDVKGAGVKQRGFTLIEVMIVVGIIGIGVILAIPMYLDYIVRARVVEGLSLASVAQLAVAERSGENNLLPLTQQATGYVSPSSTANVVSITIANNGSAEITITYTLRAGGGTIILKPVLQATHSIIWTCTDGTLENKYRPATCRS